MKERIAYLDALKGFGILLMVMAHTIAWNFNDWTIIMHIEKNTPLEYLHAGFLWNFIYSFHMPMFFSVSGYLICSERSGGGDILKKKTLRLLIPYFSTGILILLLRGYYGYWFLLSLWQLSILGIVYNTIFSKIGNVINRWFELLIMILIGLIFMAINSMGILNELLASVCDISKCNYYIIPFSFGYYMKKHYGVEKFFENNYSFILAVFVIMITNKYYFPEDNVLMYFHKIINHLSTYFLPICGTMVFWIMFKSIGNNNFIQVFSYIGRKSLSIYILHLFFVVQVEKIGDFWIKSNLETCITTQLIYSFFISLIAIGISILIAIVIGEGKIASKLLFG